MYECRNRLGERIGHAYTKQQAEEMIRHANWLLDQKEELPNMNKELQERKSRRKRNECYGRWHHCRCYFLYYLYNNGSFLIQSLL